MANSDVPSSTYNSACLNSYVDRTISVSLVISIHDLSKMLSGGALDKWNDADMVTKESVWDRILQWSSFYHNRTPTLSQINDWVWFECDDLFYHRKDD